MVVDAISSLVRGLSFLALFQAAGVALFLALFGRQLASTAPDVRSLGFASSISAILLVSAHYALEAGRMAGTLAGVLDPSLQELVLHSPTSTAWIYRAAGLGLIAATIRSDGKVATVIGLIGAGAVVAGFLFVGHSSVHPDRAWLSLLLAVHLVVIALWFGSLLPLIAVSRAERLPVAAAVVNDFSRIAIWLVPVILLAGAVMAFLLIERWATFKEGYGLLLLAKIAGFAALMGLAALNRWRYGPALAEAGNAFRRTVAIEYVLICAVLFTSAVMTTLFSPGSD